MKINVLFLTVLFKFSLCRDFYVGMFRKNDLLVAQDTLYKERNSFGFAVAKYGKRFNCPITYLRVSDRLGFGSPPTVIINRGGLQKKYLTLVITSSYRTPIAVNIYIGCENKMVSTTQKVTTKAAAAQDAETTTANAVEGETPAGNEATPEQEGAGDKAKGEAESKAPPADAAGEEKAPPAEGETEAPPAEGEAEAPGS